MRPDFLVLGAQKCGTTWLGRVLGQHPDVYVAPAEIHYFDKRANVAKGDAWYEAHFAEAGGRRRIGEKTPDYFWPNGHGAEDHDPDVHRHVHRYMPDGRFLLILRDPAKRAVSAVNHLMRTRRISPLPAVDDYLLGRHRAKADAHGVLDYGFYQRHLDAYLELFDRRQFKVLVFEEATRDPLPALAEACRFLGVDPGFAFRDVHEKANAATRSRARLAVDHYAPPLRPVSRVLDRIRPAKPLQPTPATMDELRRLYADENRRLERFLGRRLPWG